MIEKVINGETVTFTKSSQSHLHPDECLYAGQASDGTAYLFESADDSVMIATTPSKLQKFAQSYMDGEFDHIK